MLGKAIDSKFDSLAFRLIILGEWISINTKYRDLDLDHYLAHASKTY